MTFCDELREEASDIWYAYHEHPFVKGIGDGTLDRDKFQYWLREDYVYLIDYARAFAFAAGKANELEVMQKFAELLDGVLNTEMELHRQYAARFGIFEDELERVEKSPTCQAYTDFLVRTASVGTLPEIIAALVPCFWGFLEIGKRLAETGDTSENNPYRDWIEMYSSDEFQELSDWSKEMMNEMAEEASEGERGRLKEIFVISSRLELEFWDMAYEME
ncbi:MAG: thiaminase II [Candidatus Saliniplasma sp.]